MEVLNNIQPNQLVNINSTTPIEFNGALADGVTVAGQGKDKTTIVIPNNGGTGYIINNEDVTFSDVKIDGTAVTNKNGYNAVLEVKKDGTKIDNCEITGGGMSTWNSSVLVMGSAAGDKTEVTNTKISGAFRGILLESGNGDLNVDGCDITAIYPISVDGASATTNITVSNSKLNGWTSYSSVNSVSFNNVQFGFGCGYGYLKAYSSTSFDGCSFADGFKMGCGFTTAHTYTLNNCTYNGVKITATNFLTTLFDKDDSGEFNTLRNNATVIVDGVTVTLA